MDRTDDDQPVASTSSGLTGFSELPCLEDGNFQTSYTWHSVGKYEQQEQRKQGDQDDQDDEPESWIIGIDEAGRGPVLGPQVYGCAFCPASFSDGLKALGFADSKTLTDDKRRKLMEEILGGEAREKGLHYGVTVMHPQDISSGMLQRNNYSLNAQSQDVTVKLIGEVLNKGYPVSHIFVDPVGPHELYEAKLKAIFPTVQFTVVPKADALFPVVSAASIVAKVTRDVFMEVWKFAGEEAGLPIDHEFGSGYPSDPRTVAWLERHWDPIFGYPSIARQSWGTIRQLFEKKGHKAKWCEDESINSIRSYFTSNRPGEDRERPAVLKDLGLTSVAAL